VKKREYFPKPSQLFPFYPHPSFYLYVFFYLYISVPEVLNRRQMTGQLHDLTTGFEGLRNRDKHGVCVKLLYSTYTSKSDAAQQSFKT
jgi:hypothetical protein